MSAANVLGDDIGRIELWDWLGGDLASVNAARASYRKRRHEINDRDIHLIGRLGRDRHHTPLRHTYVQLFVEAPEFVSRQWYKSIVGSDYTSEGAAYKDTPWSEASQRFAAVSPTYYVPRVFRCQSDTNKQASEGQLNEPAGVYATTAEAAYRGAMYHAFEAYRLLLDRGVAREQARMVLPLAVYTSFVWTASIQAVVHFCKLRDSADAQWEIQQYAKALRELVQPLAPHTWAALEAA